MASPERVVRAGWVRDPPFPVRPADSVGGCSWGLKDNRSDARETRSRQWAGEGAPVRTPDGLDGFRWRWMLLRRPRTEWFFLLHAATGPAGFQDVRVCGRDGISDARLVWKVCHQCERGVISKISLSPEVQRQGLGTCLVDRALLDGPGYRWTTSSQSPDGRAFFRAMTARTGAEFAAGARTCEHILESRPGRHRPVLDRRLHRARR